MHNVSALQQLWFSSCILMKGLIQDLLRPMENFSLSFLGFGSGLQLTAGKITSIPKLLNQHSDNYNNFLFSQSKWFSLIMAVTTVFRS